MAINPDLAGAIETYEPTARQGAFHRDPAKIRLLLGAFGAGKTKAIIWENILTALEYPGLLAVIFRKTYPALRDTTKADFLGELPATLIRREMRSEGREAVELLNGSRIWFRCLDQWMKLGSQAFDLATFDEAYEFEENDFTMVSRGRLRGRVGPRRMLLATNPPDETHWLHKHFVENPNPDYSVHHFSTYDNKDNLPKGYIEGLEKMPLAWKRRYLYGQWGFISEGEPVYAEYREEWHRDTLPYVHGAVIRRGWDFGWQHPACVWMQYLANGHINVIDELVGTKEDLRVFARRVLQRSFERYPRAKFEDYVDRAGLQHHNTDLTAVRILRQMNIAPRFQTIALEPSIDAMRWAITQLQGGRPLLQVDRHCKVVNNAFAGGYYMGKDGTPTKDGKIYEHVMDALRMALAPIVMPLVAQAVTLPPIHHQRYAV